jgi:hypothetical protein
MDRREFIIGVAAFPLALGLPNLPAPLDAYDLFLLELDRRVRKTLIENEATMQRLIIDPLQHGRRLVHLYAGSGEEYRWFQWYPPPGPKVDGHGDRYLLEIFYAGGGVRRTFLLEPRWSHFWFSHWGNPQTDRFVFSDMKFCTTKIVNAAYGG